MNNTDDKATTGDAGATDSLNQAAPVCGSGCSCNAPGGRSKARLLVGVIVLAVAGLLVARAVMKSSSDKAAAAPAKGCCPGQCGSSGCN